MRTRPAWHPAQSGVSLYVPAKHVSIRKTQESLSQLSVSDEPSSGAQSQVSNISDTVLPSCEDGPDVHIKSEPADTAAFDPSRSDSEETLVGDLDEEVLCDAAPKATSTPESSASSDLLFQLMAAAENATPEIVTFYDASTLNDVEPSPDGDLIDTGYASDRTDYLESTPSPSLRKRHTARKHSTEVKSRHFKHGTGSKKIDTVRRRLFSAKKTVKQISKKAHLTGDAKSLQELKDIEYHTRNKWNERQRELLAVMNRWYFSEDITAIPTLFNAVLGLDLRHDVIRNQFKGHMCYYGPQAIRGLDKVFRVPFDDPHGYYAEDRTRLEEQAISSGIALKRRHTEADFDFGRAAKIGSPGTKTVYRDMVLRRLQKEEDEAAKASKAADVVFAAKSLTTISMAVRVPTEDCREVVTDMEQSPIVSSDTIVTPGMAPSRPHLVFRVFGRSTRGKFIEGRFLAEAFLPQNWKRELPGPIPPDDPYEAFKIFASLHISRYGDTPVLLSTASSLLQVLRYATEMENPRLALIDLDAPSLQRDHKVHHVADVLRGLQSEGIVHWAKYKAHGEYMVWCDIPNDAILHVLELGDLQDEVNANPDCSSVLNLDVFQPGIKTGKIASKLGEMNIVLNTTNAKAMGKLAKIFGLAGAKVRLEHVQDFVARLVDGWSISKADSTDLHTMSSLAATFATAFGSHDAAYNLQDIMGAFIDGVDDGTKCIARWSRSRSGSRRQRFRTA